MNISQALANKIGASALIIWSPARVSALRGRLCGGCLRKLVTYPHFLVGLHNFFDAR
jgi:hypothetical protein